MWFHGDTIIRYSAGLFIRVRSIRTSLRDGGTTARPHHVHHPASWFPLGSRLSLLSRRAALLCQTSQKNQAGRVAWQVLTRGTPLDHSCGRVAKLALERRRVQQRCPRGFSSAATRAPTPEPDKGRRPKNRHSSKAKSASARVFCLLPVLAFFCRGFPGSRSLVLWALPLRVPVCFGSASCFFLLAAGVTFQLPAGGTSGQIQGAPTQEPAFFRYPPSLSTF